MLKSVCAKVIHIKNKNVTASRQFTNWMYNKALSKTHWEGGEFTVTSDLKLNEKIQRLHPYLLFLTQRRFKREVFIIMWFNCFKNWKTICSIALDDVTMIGNIMVDISIFLVLSLLKKLWFNLLCFSSISVLHPETCYQ